jgi:hydrogenase-4 component E
MKENLLIWVSLAIILTNFYAISSSRLTYMIKAVAAQGFLLSILPLLLINEQHITEILILMFLGIVIKGLVIPHYLFKTIKDIKVQRNVNPLIGFSFSIIYALVTSVLAFYIVKKIGSNHIFSSAQASVAIATAFIGLYIIIARRNVVSQIIGYLILENAGFILSLSVAVSQPLFVEMGVLLDVLVGVFIMTIAVNHIYLEHNSVEVDSLERLTQ